MKIPLQQLLDHLDTIRLAHPELADPDVREALAVAIYHCFILRTPGASLPESLGMVSAEGNAAVRIALAEFLDAAANTGARTPQQRFAAFQDATVASHGGQCYADYFGYQPSYEELVAAMTRPAAPRVAAPKPAGAWWQFWKHPRTS